jgi:hypothetical protein
LSTPLTITYNPLPPLSLENISKHWKHSRGLTKYLLLKIWVKKIACFNIVLNLKHELTRKYLCTSYTWNNIPLSTFAYLNKDHNILFRPFPIMEYLITNSRISFIAMMWENIVRL